MHPAVNPADGTPYSGTSCPLGNGPPKLGRHLAWRHGHVSGLSQDGSKDPRRYGDDMPNLNLGQRVILVVALGAVCVAVDGFATPRFSGWFAYAPNSGDVFDPDARAKLKVLGLRLALTFAWATSSFFLLRSPK